MTWKNAGFLIKVLLMVLACSVVMLMEVNWEGHPGVTAPQDARAYKRIGRSVPSFEEYDRAGVKWRRYRQDDDTKMVKPSDTAEDKTTTNATATTIDQSETKDNATAKDQNKANDNTNIENQNDSKATASNENQNDPKAPATTEDQNKAKDNTNIENQNDPKATATTENQNDPKATATTEDQTKAKDNTNIKNQNDSKATASNENQNDPKATATTDDQNKAKDNATTEEQNITNENATAEEQNKTKSTATTVDQNKTKVTPGPAAGQKTTNVNDTLPDDVTGSSINVTPGDTEEVTTEPSADADDDEYVALIYGVDYVTYSMLHASVYTYVVILFSLIVARLMNDAHPGLEMLLMGTGAVLNLVTFNFMCMSLAHDKLSDTKYVLTIAVIVLLLAMVGLMVVDSVINFLNGVGGSRGQPLSSKLHCS